MEYWKQKTKWAGIKLIAVDIIQEGFVGIGDTSGTTDRSVWLVAIASDSVLAEFWVGWQDSDQGVSG